MTFDLDLSVIRTADAVRTTSMKYSRVSLLSSISIPYFVCFFFDARCTRIYQTSPKHWVLELNSKLVIYPQDDKQELETSWTYVRCVLVAEHIFKIGDASFLERV